MRFQCPHCGGINEVDDSSAGKAVNCTSCSTAAAVPPHHLAPGAVVNDFVIKEKIGSGGSNTTVYQAHQISLDRPVALKIVHEAEEQDESVRNELLREGRAAARLTHSSIVQAYAAGEEGGVYYFAMEYVEGTTLHEILTQTGRMVVDQALTIIAQIAEALAHAWEKEQLVHNDIKPSNIILSKRGEKKLADLGLAHRPAESAEQDETVSGTPQYIAPEHLQGKGIDCRADIYSLGGTLYCALTGTPPYVGKNALETAKKHLTTRLTPPEKIVSEISANVSHLVQCMLTKRPEHRYSSYRELLQDMKRVQRGKAPTKELPEDAQKPLLFEDGEEQTGEGKEGSEKKKRETRSQKKEDSERGTESKGSAGGKRLKTHSGRSKKTLSHKGKSSRSDSGSEGDARAASTRSGSGRSGRTRPNTAQSKAEGDQNNQTGTQEQKASAGKKKAAVGVLCLLALLVAGGVSVVLISGGESSSSDGKNGQNQASQGESENSADSGGTGENEKRKNTLLELKKMVKSNADASEILQTAETAIAQAQGETVFITKVRKIIRKVLEKKVRQERQVHHQKQMQNWEERAQKLRRQHLKETAEERRAAVERLRNAAKGVNAQEWAESYWERATRLQKKARQAFEEENFEKAGARWQSAKEALQEAIQAGREKQEEKQNLKQRYDKLREKALNLCRKNKYLKAKELFIPLKTSDFPECQAWAEQKMKTIDVAKEVFSSVAGTDNKLKGKDFTGRDDNWKVDYIGSSKIGLRLIETSYKNGEWKKETTRKTKLPLKDVSASAMLDLYKMLKLGSKDKKLTSELKYKFGAYLLARGKNKSALDMAKNFLAAYGKPPSSKMLKELEKVRVLVVERSWTKRLDRLKLWVNQGRMEKAKRFVEYLKQKYPDKYAESKEEIRRILRE